MDDIASVPCAEFNQFKQVIGELRTLDDRLTHKLNTTVPTASNVDDVDARANCTKLWEQMTQAHDRRTAALERCLTEINADIINLKQALGTEDRDMRASQGKGKTDVRGRSLREKQGLAREIKRELVAEEILQEQTTKVFKDRCGRYYTPPR